MGRGMTSLIGGVFVLLIGYLQLGSVHQDVHKSCSGLLFCQIQESSPSSYIWMDYTHRDRPLQYWLRIKENGDAWWVRYSNLKPVQSDDVAYPRILESKSGRLPPEEVQALFDLIKTRGFFQMKKAYSGEEAGVVSEDDILELCANIEGAIKAVYARPPSFIPTQLSYIVQAIRAKVRGLQEDKRFGAFLRAEKLDEARAKSLENKLEFTAFSEKELKGHPYLWETIESPGQFVYAGSWKGMELNSPPSKHNFLLVSTPQGRFQIDIYLRERP